MKRFKFQAIFLIFLIGCSQNQNFKVNSDESILFATHNFETPIQAQLWITGGNYERIVKTFDSVILDDLSIPSEVSSKLNEAILSNETTYFSPIIRKISLSPDKKTVFLTVQYNLINNPLSPVTNGGDVLFFSHIHLISLEDDSELFSSKIYGRIDHVKWKNNEKVLVWGYDYSILPIYSSWEVNVKNLDLISAQENDHLSLSSSFNQEYLFSHNGSTLQIFKICESGKRITSVEQQYISISGWDWAPFSNQLIVTGQNMGDKYFSVKLMDAQSKALDFNFSNDELHFVNNPIWSPNGKYIAFNSVKSNQTTTLIILDSEGNLVVDFPLARSYFEEMYWSSNGGRILLLIDEPPSSGMKIGIFDLTNNHLQYLALPEEVVEQGDIVINSLSW